MQFDSSILTLGNLPRRAVARQRRVLAQIHEHDSVVDDLEPVEVEHLVDEIAKLNVLHTVAQFTFVEPLHGRLGPLAEEVPRELR